MSVLDRFRLATSNNIIRWNKVAGRSNDKQLTRLCLSHHVRIDPRIRTGDKQRQRTLSASEFLKQTPVIFELAFLKLTHSIDDFLHD